MSPLHCLLIIVLCGRHTHESSAGTKAFFIAVFGFIILPCRALTEKQIHYHHRQQKHGINPPPLLQPPTLGYLLANSWLEI